MRCPKHSSVTVKINAGSASLMVEKLPRHNLSLINPIYLQYIEPSFDELDEEDSGELEDVEIDEKEQNRYSQSISYSFLCSINYLIHCPNFLTTLLSEQEVD